MRLSTDGDYLERQYWSAFIRSEFPRYERFWLAFVVPVTTRDTNRTNPRLKTNHELAVMHPPRTRFDVYLGQLHYSVLWNLCAAYALRHAPRTFTTEFDLFVHCIIRLTSALDAADELLQRHNEVYTGGYNPWSAGRPAAARNAWRGAHADAARLSLQEYRNHVAHSGALMSIRSGNDILVPRLGHFQEYRDWRSLTPLPSKTTLGDDFRTTEQVATKAWKHTLRYLEKWWRWLLHKRGSRVRLQTIQEPAALPTRNQTYILSGTYFPPNFWNQPVP